MGSSFLMILVIVALGLFVNVDAQGSAGLCVPAVKNEKEIISYLSFKSLSDQDDGIYRCVAVGSTLMCLFQCTTVIFMPVETSPTSVKRTEDSSAWHPQKPPLSNVYNVHS
ncbi:hypothetical protein AOLI_G00089650 [Acnodon oligacanthus]